MDINKIYSIAIDYINQKTDRVFATGNRVTRELVEAAPVLSHFIYIFLPQKLGVTKDQRREWTDEINNFFKDHPEDLEKLRTLFRAKLEWMVANDNVSKFLELVEINGNTLENLTKNENKGFLTRLIPDLRKPNEKENDSDYNRAGTDSKDA
jgi:hypothetical protein